MQISWIFPTSRRGWFWLAIRMVFLIVIPVAACLWYMIAIPGESYRGSLAPLSAAELVLADRMSRHVNAIAKEEHNTRHPAALADAAQYIEAQLADMGYAVARQNFACDTGEVHNIEVEIKGSTKSEEIIVVGAHYDSALGAPGANDNASGTAMVLELARSFKDSHPDRTVRFVLFVNEEPPYFGSKTMGSMVYANRSHARGENIVAMLSLETIGHYDDAPDSQKYPSIFKPFFPNKGNFIGFVGDVKSRSLVHRTIKTFRSAEKFPSEGVATFPWIIGINWSDHEAFWKNDYRALMITDTAPFRYPYYHSRGDTADRVNYQNMARVFQGVRAVVADLTTVLK
jgi:Zn-dependent M28 family amino/carboxypeptidase